MLSACLCALLLSFALPAQGAMLAVDYAPSERVLANPLIGNMAWASDDSDRPQPFTLVYANLRWADWEPEEGVFDFASFEEVNHFDEWRAQGKRLVLRFVMDVPSDKKHMDIPDWLYRATGKDGRYYRVSYGRGYCPNYDNQTLIEAHRLAIAALASRYGDDPFVAFIELGSLGHWGEWHVHPDAGAMPGEATRDAYAQAYADAFAPEKLLMRRPFRFAAENGLGLYNDTAGDPKSTGSWLTWIAQGGEYNETGESDALVAMPDGWRSAPIGGELSTGYSVEQLLVDHLNQTLALFEASHTSWIGPSSFVKVEKDGALQSALNQVMNRVGYRLRVSRAALTLGEGQPTLTLTWQNDGNAPLYVPWQAVLRLTDATGLERFLPLQTDLTAVMPDVPQSETVSLPAIEGESYTLSVAILDPDTGKPGIALAMDVPREGDWYTLLTFKP